MTPCDERSSEELEDPCELFEELDELEDFVPAPEGMVSASASLTQFETRSKAFVKAT